MIIITKRNVSMADRGSVTSDQNQKKIRFRAASRVHYINDDKVEDHFNDEELSNCWDRDDTGKDNHKARSKADELKNPSLFKFLGVELTRSYLLEHDEERYSARREKVYSFMKIPREVEKFMTYGFFQCADSFLFVYTFLPLRFILALITLVCRSFQQCFGSHSHSKAILAPAEICDILKAFIVIVCSCLMFYIDTNMMYHLIKSQSVIKLYIFFNMLEVGDRLFSAFGQDTIDALFWTAAEPRDRRREHLGVIPHLLFAGAYVFFHSLLVLCQATTLNVAINSNNKALLTIMMSNNFVELKGSVFKKFDKNNLFQVSCSDVRERFHLFVLLFIVVLQTMKEYSWKQERFWVLVPDCLMVLFAELLVDWLKHAFITRFNELPVDVYRDYTISLAYDMAQTRQKHAFSDHSDLVARRMGFIPLPLGVVMVRVLAQAIHIDGPSAFSLLVLAYMCLASFRVLNSIVILGKACDLIKQHRLDKAARAGDLTPPWNRASSPTNHRPPPVSSHLHSILNGRSTLSDRPVVRQLVLNSPSNPLSAVSSLPLKSSHPDTPQGGKTPIRGFGLGLPEHIAPPEPVPVRKISDIDTTASCHLGPAAIFSNSAVDINNVCLNEELLSENSDEGPATNMKFIREAEALTRSEPNIVPALGQQGSSEDRGIGIEDSQSSCALTPGSLGLSDGLCYGRKAESEPSIPLALEADEGLPAALPQTQNLTATKVDH